MHKIYFQMYYHIFVWWGKSEWGLSFIHNSIAHSNAITNQIVKLTFKKINDNTYRHTTKSRYCSAKWFFIITMLNMTIHFQFWFTWLVCEVDNVWPIAYGQIVQQFVLSSYILNLNGPGVFKKLKKKHTHNRRIFFRDKLVITKISNKTDTFVWEQKTD